MRLVLYVGHFTSLVISCYVFEAAPKCEAQRLQHLRALKQSLNYLSNFKTKILHNEGSVCQFRPEAMSDSLMREVEQRTNVREEVMVSRKSGSIDYVIGWSKKLARHVARSTCTAEQLAVAEATDTLTFLSHVLKELSAVELIELVVD